MSSRAITKRIVYIDSRLRYRQDYPSAADIVRGPARALRNQEENRQAHPELASVPPGLPPPHVAATCGSPAFAFNT